MTRRRSILNRLPAPRLVWLIPTASLAVLVLMIVEIVRLLADLDPLMRFLAFEWIALLVFFSALGVVVGLIARR